MIDRFTLYSSNLLPRYVDTNSPFDIIAGHKVGLTFATQITKTETLRSETTFGTLMRGLQVFGMKVVRATRSFVCTPTHKEHTTWLPMI